MKAIFWISMGVIGYTYLLYTMLLAVLSGFIRLARGKQPAKAHYEPEITLLVPAYNESDSVEKKLENSFGLDYPKEKLHHLWVTDGSDDGTPGILGKFSEVTVLHHKTRSGKIEAMNRGIEEVSTPIVVFSDANTDLSKNALREIVSIFSDERVGCVAGEKRIYSSGRDKAVGAGEGLYWQYESLIKRLESGIHSTMGAAGELFAIRTSLYEKIKKDTILDDLTISLNIARKGYKIKYAPKATASENASFSIHEELKRKIRIASGGFQLLFRMPGLLNIFKYGFLSFEYISHKVFRWTLVPVSFIALFFSTVVLAAACHGKCHIYNGLLLIQLLFYLLALAGGLLRNKKTRIRQFFLPYYLFIMNYSILVGMIRFFSRRHTALWEKAKRS